jgi:penicillin-binding protein 1C
VAGGESRRVISRVASAIALDMLSDAAARIPGFGTSTPFDFPFSVAVKTGTSRHFTDNWAVGTTRRFTVAVWAGNFSGRPMQGVSGVTGAGPLLHRAVMATARRVPPGVLTTPAEVGAVSVAVCRLSGLVATSECAQLAEWFASGTEPRRVDDWERGGRVVLPDEYAEWARQGLTPAMNGVTLASVGEGTGPTESANGALPAPAASHSRDEAARDSARAERSARFRIVSPLNGDRYAIPPSVERRYATIALRAAGVGAEGVRWWINGEPYEGTRWALAPGSHVVRAVSARGERAEVRIVVVDLTSR